MPVAGHPTVVCRRGRGPPAEARAVSGFVPIPPPRDEEVSAILERFVLGAAKELAAYDQDSPDEALAVLQAAEVDRRIRFPAPFRAAVRSAPGRGRR